VSDSKARLVHPSGVGPANGPEGERGERQRDQSGDDQKPTQTETLVW